jgi:UDP-glucose 4-epimerase
MPTVMVVGGAGYIGSHMVKLLLQENYRVVTLDDLSTGHRDAVVGGTFVEGSTGDHALLDRIFREHPIDAVFHFAAMSQVGESVKIPARYYLNNVANSLVLLDAMVRHGVGKLVFSSTAAVYGNPRRTPITEEQEPVPINPYGRSKWVVESLLGDYSRAHGLNSVSLRYFNAAGADPEGKLGERHEPETHLIPLVLRAALKGTTINVFGRDYPTPDGTCIRDYIHVGDLCQAHLRALEYLRSGGEGGAFNLGNGRGFSVQEVIDAARLVTNNPIRIVDAERREGDPAILVADSSRATEVLGWQPEFPELETIIAHAWNFHRQEAGED